MQAAMNPNIAANAAAPAAAPWRTKTARIASTATNAKPMRPRPLDDMGGAYARLVGATTRRRSRFRLRAVPLERPFGSSRAVRAQRASDRADGAAIDRDHRPGDVGRGRGKQEGRNSPELLGLAVPAQRNVLRLASTHLIRVAAQGVELAHSFGGDPDGQDPVHADARRPEIVGDRTGPRLSRSGARGSQHPRYRRRAQGRYRRRPRRPRGGPPPQRRKPREGNSRRPARPRPREPQPPRTQGRDRRP